MTKIDGVTAATVSLNEGVVTLRFAPSNRATVERIRAAIRANGFSPKAAEARVAGRVAARADTLLLVLPETRETFSLEAAPGAAQAVGTLRAQPVGSRVMITGTVPESARQKVVGPQRLLVRSVEVMPRAPAVVPP